MKRKKYKPSRKAQKRINAQRKRLKRMNSPAFKQMIQMAIYRKYYSLYDLIQIHRQNGVLIPTGIIPRTK